MRVELAEAAPEERSVLANLLSLYGHDWSEILGTTPEPDGRYDYHRLDAFFRDADRTPLLVRMDGRTVGFALVSRGSAIDGDPTVWDMTEFFVVRGVRRRGVGQSAAAAVFRRFAGPWQVRVMERNGGALEFWSRAIARHTDGRFEVEPWRSEAGEAWRVFRFSQPPDAG